MTKHGTGSVPLAFYGVSLENIQVCVSCADLLPCERLSCNEVNATGKQRFN